MFLLPFASKSFSLFFFFLPQRASGTMAPLGTVNMLGWFASPEVGIISLVVFLILSIALVALCAQCRR